MAAGLLATTLVGAVPLGAQGASKAQEAAPEQTERADAEAIVPLVDALAAGQPPAAATLPLTWEHQDFVKAQQEKTYVPFTIAVDPSAAAAGTAAVYVRVVRQGAAAAPAEATPSGGKGTAEPKYAFEGLTTVDVPAPADGPQRIRRAFAVPPGDYEVYVGVREHPAPAAAPSASATGTTGSTTPGAAQAPAPAGGTAPAPASAPAPATAGQASSIAAPRVGVLKQSLSVPDFTHTDLTTSSVIVADKVDVLQTPVAEANQADNPYTFGQMRIVPSTEYTFPKKGDLSIVFWIYGAAPDPATKKPDVNIDFKFYQKNGDKETYFNKTDPQVLNAQSLPPQFDPAAGHQLPGSLSVPLASFPEGQYRLEIEITDKVANKTVKRDVGFTVTS